MRCRVRLAPSGSPKVIQTSLLSLLPAEHTLTTESVPDTLALRPGLVKIAITKIQGDEEAKFHIPVQWTPVEAGALMYEIRGLTWQLDEQGIPTDYELIIKICEEFCKGRKL